MASVRIAKEHGKELLGRTIDIIVGSEQRVYSVHGHLIRASSPFFDKAMAGEWKESAERTVRLPDDEPEIFTLYIHWLYYGTLPVICDQPGLRGNMEYLDLAKAYVLGDRLSDARFMNAAIDAIVEKSRATAIDGNKWYPVGDVITYVYQHTADSAPIRELLVDFYASYGSNGWLKYWADSATVPQPFLLRLTAKLRDRKYGEPVKAHEYYSQVGPSSQK